jgi:hypothetical protein
MRYRFQAAGAKHVLETTITETIKMKGGGWDSDYQPIPTVQTTAVETKAVSADGTAEVALEVLKDEEVKEGTTEDTHMMDITGVTGTFMIDSAGEIAEIDFIVPSPPLVAQVGKRRTPRKQFLGMVSTSLRLMWPPLPEEPIGVGAKWTVTRVVPESRTLMREVMTVELVERTESEAVLRFEFESTGNRHHDFRENSQDVAITAEGKGQVTFARNELVPRSADLEHQSLSIVTIVGAEEKPDGTLHQTVGRTVKVRRK